jgi:hypothetical protein
LGLSIQANARELCGLGLRISDFGFPSDFGFRISDFSLQLSDFSFQLSVFGLRSSVFGFRARKPGPENRWFHFVASKS